MKVLMGFEQNLSKGQQEFSNSSKMKEKTVYT